MPCRACADLDNDITDAISNINDGITLITTPVQYIPFPVGCGFIFIHRFLDSSKLGSSQVFLDLFRGRLLCQLVPRRSNTLNPCSAGTTSYYSPDLHAISPLDYHISGPRRRIFSALA